MQLCLAHVQDDSDSQCAGRIAPQNLKARAAMAGMSLSDYLLSEIRKSAEVPTLDEFRERLHKLEPVTIPIDTVRILHEGRDKG
jgi:hypothetical protein